MYANQNIVLIAFLLNGDFRIMHVPKNMFRKLAGVSIGEEVSIYLLEFIHRQVTTGAVFQEPFVPFLNFRIY